MNKLVLFACLLFVFACKNDPAPIQKLPDMTPNSGALGFEVKNLARSEGGCSIKADYVLASGGVASARNAINTEILKILISGMSPQHSVGTQTYASIDACADAFVASYKAQQTDSKMRGTWATDIKVERVHEDDYRICLRQKISQQIADQAYQEGRFLLFDKKTGRLLSAEELFSDLDAVRNLIVTAFRSKYGEEAVGKVFDLPDGQTPALDIGMDRASYYFMFNTSAVANEEAQTFEVAVPVDYLKVYLK